MNDWNVMTPSAGHRASRSRKLILQTALGAVTGGASMVGLLWLVDSRGFDVDRVDHVVTLGAGLVLALMSLLVVFGAAMPTAGAKVLNVEDEAEIRHQRQDLVVAAICMLLLAAGLVGLSLYSNEGETVIGRRTASIIVGASLAASVVVSLVFRLKQDELNQLLVKEATAFTGNGILVIFGGWATLAHLGYVELFSPIAFVGGCVAIFLLGLFIVMGRRGVLTS